MADLCAFVIRGHLCGRDRYLRLYNRLKSMMFMFAKEDENYYGPKITARPPYASIEYVQSSENPFQILYNTTRPKRS